ncbi:hypothetical protein GIB67_003658 [Kingdonia uniflora]|uniref:SWIM-type domain-containing protein n=1 Tax=Kingdonia uniflora TaxID=39325 RepID=A0A7J7M3W1_9MAGN|nr:hypothetical protein GIB67_003658 [Kingdonia uniflora]
MNAIRNTDPVGLQYILGIPKETWSNLYILMSRMAAETFTSIDSDKHMNAIRNSNLVGLQYILGIPKETWSNLYIPLTRYGVAYTNHVESWNNVILKVRDLPIHVFIEELHKICLEMFYTYREEAEKSQAHLMPWASDYCENKKFEVDLLTCKVCTSRHHFQMTCYGRIDSANIEDGTCSCRWWQTMSIPYEHGVRALSLANVDPTTRVSVNFTNNTYKAIYEPIWIPIRGIEQWKILKTDPRVHAPIPTVQASRPRTQRKRKEKIHVSCAHTGPTLRRRAILPRSAYGTGTLQSADLSLLLFDTVHPGYN